MRRPTDATDFKDEHRYVSSHLFQSHHRQSQLVICTVHSASSFPTSFNANEQAACKQTHRKDDKEKEEEEEASAIIRELES